MATRILANGGRAIGPHNDGRNFPFVLVDPAVDGLLADVWVSYDLPEIVEPLHITQLTGFGQYFDYNTGTWVTTPRVIIADAEDTVLLDSTDAVTYTSKAFGDRLRCHEWRTPTVICRIVQHTAFPSLAAVVTWPVDIFPDPAVLDIRCVARLPKRLKSITVNAAQLGGNIKFVNGYNTTLDVATPATVGARRRTAITIGGEAGSGLGRQPGCVESDIVIRRINGIPGDAAGNLLLAAGGCYYVRQPQEDGFPVTLVPATLKLGNDCGPCCDCEDFVAVYKGMRRTFNKFRSLAARAEATRDLYKSNIERFEAQRECVEDDVLDINLSTFNKTHFEVAASVCNTTPHCLTNIEMHITLEIQGNAPGNMSSSSDGGGCIQLDQCSVQQSDARGRMGVGYVGQPEQAHYTIFWDVLYPGRAGVVRFRGNAPNCFRDNSGANLTACMTTWQYDNDGVTILPYPQPTPRRPVQQQKCVTRAFSDCYQLYPPGRDFTPQV